MRLSDLRDARVKTLDGNTLGRVHEVHVEDGRVTALTCGPGSFIERLTARTHGRRVPWECVRRIAPGEVVVVPDPPQRIVKSSGSRARRGTRRPSAPRSKR
ncbi:MAG: PRC-barrel domain-containing protein [Sphingomicrobium sp.]|jgi:sporulation protein YlmC with PRC-barrel domain